MRRGMNSTAASTTLTMITKAASCSSTEFTRRAASSSIPELLDAIRPLHGGHNVYHSRDACVAALRKMEAHGFSWWTSECSAFVDQVEGAENVSKNLSSGRAPLLVVEGLDGVGKTTVVNALVQRLDGKLVRTPDPSLEPLRALFRGLDEPLARAFYCGCNYLSAPLMVDLCSMEQTPVVVDRWWCSTCAMSLAETAKEPAGLPPHQSSVYAWPSDLPRFDVGALLFVDENVRRLRMNKRADENVEEARLAAHEPLRRAAMQAYTRMGTLSLVEVPNYAQCVNDILCIVKARGFSVPDGAFFTQDEIQAVKPY